MTKVVLGKARSAKRETCPVCQRLIRVSQKGRFVRHGAKDRLCPTSFMLVFHANKLDWQIERASVEQYAAAHPPKRGER